MTTMTLGDRIKAVRKAKDLTQEQFAKEIGSSANVLTNYETGRRNPSKAVVNNICKTFNVSEEWLRTGKGSQWVPRNESDEITSFFGDLMKGEPDFRNRFVAVLARMTPDEWKLLEKKALELAEEMKKAGPNGSAQ